MNLQDIYESFFDTYRNMGYIISELSQRTLRRAGAVAWKGALANAESKPTGNDRDDLAKTLNQEKLLRQSDKFGDAADEKAKKSRLKAVKLTGNETPSQRSDKYSRGKRVGLVNKDLQKTKGFTSDKEYERASKKAATDANDVKRLRKRFKGELDG